MANLFGDTETARKEIPTDRKCSKCDRPLRAFLRESGVHYADLRCPVHGHQGMLPKPETDPARRPAAHKDLVAKFGSGFCELCLRMAEELPIGQALIGHHVREFAAEQGEPTRENIWILCTGCHELIDWMRERVGHHVPGGQRL